MKESVQRNVFILNIGLVGIFVRTRNVISVLARNVIVLDLNGKRNNMSLELIILNESGCMEAIKGLEFSFEPECPLDEMTYYVSPEKYKVALGLAKKDKGHNKFLESMMVWMDIRTTMNFWKQFDTYRIGVTKLSKSTMHTILKRDLSGADFGAPIPEGLMSSLNYKRLNNDFEGLINILPMGYLQTRRVCMNYKAIRGMILQRRGHKLPEWGIFIDAMKCLKHHELLGV